MPAGRLVRVVKATGGGTPGRAVASRSTNIIPRRRRYRKKKPTGYAVSKSFMKAYNKLAPSKELKQLFQDATMNTSTLAAATEVLNLTPIVQGTQINQRQGASIHVSYVHFKGSITSDSTVKYKSLRIMIIKEYNHGHLDTVNLTDLLTTSNAYTTHAPAQNQADGADRINREQYYVFFDKRYKVPLESEGVRYINERVRINRRIHFQIAEPTNPNTTRGILYMIALLYDNDTVTSATTCPFVCNVTTYFKDSRKLK